MGIRDFWNHQVVTIQFLNLLVVLILPTFSLQTKVNCSNKNHVKILLYLNVRSEKTLLLAAHREVKFTWREQIFMHTIGSI